MKSAIVYGAGVSGLSAEKLLKKVGYKVYLVDDNKGISSKDAIKILDEINLFIKSPGIPYTELVMKAKAKGIEIIDEVELAYRELVKCEKRPKIIAITGTNGKTTITSKIKEMLEFSGKKCEYAGNIGVPFTKLVEEIKDGKILEYIVLELSSYQLENIKEFKADISMIINLAPDHLDRYNSLEEYYQAKLNITKNQKEEDFFILNLDSKEIMERINLKDIKKVSISKEEKKSDFYCKNGQVLLGKKSIVKIDDFSLKGIHNLENNLFILAVGNIVGIDFELMVKFLKNTKALEHRMEEFYEIKKVKFVNDSKGTNIDSTRMAIGAYENPILICGGVDKDLELLPLIDIILKKIKEVYLIGEIANKIETKLIEKKFPTNKIHNLKTLENVVDHLKKNIDINVDNTILLSPATASFDQFKNYIIRGNEFKRLIKKSFRKED